MQKKEEEEEELHYCHQVSVAFDKLAPFSFTPHPHLRIFDLEFKIQRII